MTVSNEATNAANARVGIALQGVGFLVVWVVRSRRWVELFDSSARIAVLALAVLLAIAALALVGLSIAYLGRHWSIGARTIQNHTLITNGPYAIVRHPIYLGMGALLTSVGLAFAPIWALVAALALYALGTQIRTDAEDGLMAEAFGETFEAYRRRVPRLIPKIPAA